MKSSALKTCDSTVTIRTKERRGRLSKTVRRYFLVDARRLERIKESKVVSLSMD